MPARVPCKFFARGMCIKGEHCAFLHNAGGVSNNVCTYYQKGACSFGSRCRYEHVKASGSHSSSAFSSTNSGHSTVSEPVSSLAASTIGTSVPTIASQEHAFGSSNPTLGQESSHHDFSNSGDVAGSSYMAPTGKPICPSATVGNCSGDEKCSSVSTCENEQNIDALKLSQDIECGVCLERVLSKSNPAERKFGLLSECDHSFCIACIRNWRSSSPANGMANNASRACPICRKHSYFVIPSVIWYSTKEGKQQIVGNYKLTLRSIDCKHFDFGNGRCPFGTSCFYKHTVKPGSYTWNNHRPPPRHRTNQVRFDDMVGMAGMLSLLDEWGDEDMPENFDVEDLFDEDWTPEEALSLIMPLDFDIDDESTHSEMDFLLGEMAGLNVDYFSGDE